MSEHKIEVIFDSKEPKKHSVRYNSSTGIISSIYIPNEAVNSLGNPDQLKITVEAFVPKTK